MANFTNPIKAAFGQYLHEFYKELIADTPMLQEFAGRGFSKSAVWAPGRMIDQLDDMLAAWRKNDTSLTARATPYLPVMIAAMSKDYNPAGADFARQQADPVSVMIPGDTKERVFKMRTVYAEVRCQVAVVAAEEPTAKSIAMQLQLYASAMANRRFYTSYPLAGLDTSWPVVVIAPDVSAINLPNEQKNMTAMAVDFTFVASVPMLKYPKHGSAEADGQGSGNADDPDGYLVVIETDITRYPDVNPDDIPPGVIPETETIVPDAP